MLLGNKCNWVICKNVNTREIPEFLYNLLSSV